MSDDTAAIIALIQDLDAPYDLPQQNLLLAFLTALKQTVDEGAENVGGLLALMRAGARTPCLPKRVLLASALGDMTGEARWFDRLFDDASTPSLSFEERHTLFVHILVSMFRNRGKIADGDAFRLEQVRLRALFTQLADEMTAALAGSCFAQAPAQPVKDRVVILTPQYLEPPHATTVRANEYAKTLIEAHGKTPVIVESHVNPARSPVAFVPTLASARRQDLKPVDTIDIAGHSVEYYRAASGSFGLSDLVHTVALLSALSPELVIAISCPFIAAEAAALRFPTFAQPTTAALPITVRASTFSWNAPSERERAILEASGAGLHRFHMHPGFSPPEETTPVTRAELGLPEEAFVFAVVGNRLDEEIVAPFLDLLEAVVADPRAHIAMMGRFATFDAVVARRPGLQGRVSFLGFRTDILSVLRACDASLNPDRAGGGRSGAYAQHAGLPVLTLRRGDVASTVGEAGCCDDYAEMASRAQRLIDDPALLAQSRRDALARAAQTIGVDGLVSRILAEMAA